MFFGGTQTADENRCLCGLTKIGVYVDNTVSLMMRFTWDGDVQPDYMQALMALK